MLQPKLIKVEPIDSLKLRLYYETGEVKLFDVAPYATGSWYGQLKDEDYFRTVSDAARRYRHRMAFRPGYSPS